MRDHGACALPGVTIVYDRFVPILERAVARGYVAADKAQHVVRGLTEGFSLGVDVESLRGQVRFRNYPSALEARPFITKAVMARLEAGKTLCLGPFKWLRDRVALPKACRIFPLGAVPKPLEPNERRPVSDHSRTRLNEASDLSFLRHTLNAYEEIEREFRYGYFMRVSDVDAAFPLLPLATALWPFFFFIWDNVFDGTCGQDTLYVHVCGDFGAAGLPGEFKLFFADALDGMARSEGVLTLPMSIYVDDTAHLGPDAAALDREGEAWGAWLRTLGVYLKELKAKSAATLQLMLGFWWNSITRTRTLEERKFMQYMDMLLDFASRRTLTLREMQTAAGRLQRAIMTLPPGAACFLANLFALMRGLSVPWQRRRTSRATRRDFRWLHELLELNMGRGYFSFDQFRRAPDVDTDASKSHRYAGGGYFSRCGRYRFWRYGTSSARQPIDFLEGDVVVQAMRDLGARWRRCLVTFFIDNSAFQLSAVQGWSRADRLVLLLRQVFFLSVQHEFIGQFNWISTHANVFADALSREDGEQLFLQLVDERRPLPGGVQLLRDERSGGVRGIGREYSSDSMGDGPPEAWADNLCDYCTSNWSWLAQCSECDGTICAVCENPSELVGGMTPCIDLPVCSCPIVVRPWMQWLQNHDAHIMNNWAQRDYAAHAAYMGDALHESGLYARDYGFRCPPPTPSPPSEPSTEDEAESLDEADSLDGSLSTSAEDDDEPPAPFLITGNYIDGMDILESVNLWDGESWLFFPVRVPSQLALLLRRLTVLPFEWPCPYIPMRSREWLLELLGRGWLNAHGEVREAAFHLFLRLMCACEAALSAHDVSRWNSRVPPPVLSHSPTIWAGFDMQRPTYPTLAETRDTLTALLGPPLTPGEHTAVLREAVAEASAPGDGDVEMLRELANETVDLNVPMVMVEQVWTAFNEVVGPTRPLPRGFILNPRNDLLRSRARAVLGIGRAYSSDSMGDGPPRSTPGYYNSDLVVRTALPEQGLRLHVGRCLFVQRLQSGVTPGRLFKFRILQRVYVALAPVDLREDRRVFMEIDWPVTSDEPFCYLLPPGFIRAFNAAKAQARRANDLGADVVDGQADFDAAFRDLAVQMGYGDWLAACVPALKAALTHGYYSAPRPNYSSAAEQIRRFQTTPENFKRVLGCLFNALGFADPNFVASARLGDRYSVSEGLNLLSNIAQVHQQSVSEPVEGGDAACDPTPEPARDDEGARRDHSDTPLVPSPPSSPPPPLLDPPVFSWVLLAELWFGCFLPRKWWRTRAPRFLHGRAYSSDEDGDGPSARVNPQPLSVPYTRNSLYHGLEPEEIAQVDEILDQRLAPSSMRSVSSALAKWDVLRSRKGWPRIIPSDDPRRGAKMAAFVLYLVRDTSLVAASINNYVWGLRTWMRLQHQLDPIMGVVEWSDLMDSVAVVAHVPTESRKRVPMAWIRGALRAVNRHVFWEVQAAHLMLFLLFTFNRSETPLAKAFHGEGEFDPAQHLQVQDVRVEGAQPHHPAHLASRLKAIKQDSRTERVEALGDGDWVWIGDTTDPLFSILHWTQALFAFHGARRDPESPFYVDRDRRRPYLYAKALDDIRTLWSRVVSKEEAYSCGLHGLRVAGYNGGKSHDLDLVKAHGRWHSSAHEAYARFTRAEVLALSDAIVGAGDPDAADPPPTPAPPMGPVEREVAPVQARRIGSRRRPEPASPTQLAPAAATPPTPPPDMRPLKGIRADVGRRVLIPADLWPDYECSERSGDGWVAEVTWAGRGVCTVRCVHATDAEGRPYAPARLQAAQLRPL